jgi:hypothetical protein
MIKASELRKIILLTYRDDFWEKEPTKNAYINTQSMWNYICHKYKQVKENVTPDFYAKVLNGLCEEGLMEYAGTPDPTSRITEKGLTYLKELEREDRTSQIAILGPVTMGDEYNISGQVGAVGSNAQAHDMNFTQIGNQIEKSMDLSLLANELSKLHQAMKAEGNEVEHDIAISEVAKAEQAAKAKNSSKIAEHLKSAGKWSLEIASKIGVPLAIDALKKAAGI